MIFSRQLLVLLFILACCPAPGFSAEVEIKKSKLDIPQDIVKSLQIRVSLGQEKPKVVLSTQTPFKVFDGEGRLLFQGSQIEKTAVFAQEGQIFLGRQSFKRLPLVLDSGKSVLQLDQRTYRDILEFSMLPDGRLLIVNELDLEDYLRGVLPWEANPGWKPEALKAQAVASRTYALFKMIENRGESFAVSSDVISQVYGGVTLEKTSTNQAIDATEGQILVYKGKIFPAFFHSTCGGHTTRAENAWPIEPHPSLRGGSCGFCNESPHYRWKVSLTEQELRTVLKKMGYNVTSILKLSAKDIDESGRARFFEIKYPAGKIKIPANDFRLAVSPMKMKSVFLRQITHEGHTFTLAGRGWGHGVGLCQYGIKKMAELGYTYRQILEYYYPGSEIRVLAAPELG